MSDLMGLTMKQILGDRAIHVPMHGIVQKQDDAGCVVACVFLSRTDGPHPLLFGGREAHALIHGDMVVRPAIAFVSDHLIGHGLSGLACSSSMASLDEWIANGRLVVEPREGYRAMRGAHV